MLPARNDLLRPLLRPRYSHEELAQVRELLERHGTFRFPALRSGLFSAALLPPDRVPTGYKAAWVRDNVHVAHAHLVNGRPDVARATALALAAFYSRHRWRLIEVVRDPAKAAAPMNRPHVRFDGETLAELPEKWSHAQNDALGYFVWLYAALAAEGVLGPPEFDAPLMALFADYFAAIRYWRDEDSGHWEETRKVSASSLGAVVAGLRRLRALPRDLLRAPPPRLDELIEKGTAALDAILPAECAQPDPAKHRRYDAALLFLVYPLRLLEGSMAARAVADVTDHLQGPYGIKRYLGDSFYSTDYESHLTGADLTRDYSDDLAARDAFFVEGGEAQWCLFDPIVSCYHGLVYRQTGSEDHLQKQTDYLNRALAQVTGDADRYGPFHCPELYYQEKGRWQTSKSTPLLWTQANLWTALKTMDDSLAR